jgi:hypothetical protein
MIMRLIAKILGRRPASTPTSLVRLGTVTALTLGAPGKNNKDGKYFFTG